MKIPKEMKRNIVTFMNPLEVKYNITSINKQYQIISEQVIKNYIKNIKQSQDLQSIRAIVRFMHFIYDDERHNMFDMEMIMSLKKKFVVSIEWIGERGFQISITNPETGRLIENNKIFRDNRNGIIHLIKYVYNFIKTGIQPEKPIQIKPIDIELLLYSGIIRPI